MKKSIAIVAAALTTVAQPVASIALASTVGVRAEGDVGVSFGSGAFGERTNPALQGLLGVHAVIPGIRLAAGAAAGLRHFHSLDPLYPGEHRFDIRLSSVAASVEYALADVDAALQPVFGVDAGWGWFRYRWSRETQSGETSGGGLALAPRAGFRLRLGATIDLAALVRYEFLETGTINYGDRFVTSKITGVGVVIGGAYTFGS